MTKNEIPAQTAGLVLRFQVTTIRDNGQRTSGRVLTAAATREDALAWVAKQEERAGRNGIAKVTVKFVRAN